MSLLRRPPNRGLPTIMTELTEQKTNYIAPLVLPPSASKARRRPLSTPDDESSRKKWIMGQSHMISSIILMYVVLLICRLGFGYTPGRKYVGKLHDMAPIAQNQVTLVTAYFDIPSKRPSSEYLPWIQHMMSLQDNMVIFTSPEQVETIKLLRGKRPTQLIALELSETVLAKQYGMEFWERQNSLEPGMEKYLHSKELYIVWNEKGHFLEKAIADNHFGSDFFAWVDMGYLRDDLLDDKRMIRYLPTELTSEQAMFLDVRKLVQDNYLGGGFIGGYKEGLLQWTKSYYELLDANKDRFLGKDQPWMFQNCVNQPYLCVLVPAISLYGDAWFYMAPYLHGVQFYGTTDHLLFVWKRSTLGRLFTWITTPRLDLSALASKHKASIGEIRAKDTLA
jgi:hypothetical protein